MQENIRCSFNFTVGINTVKNWLDGELFSLKNVRPTVDNMNREENRVKRAEYMEKLFDARSEGRTLVWIDETNYNLYLRRKEGRSKIGCRSAVILPASKGANLHCIGAMTSSQLVLFTTRRSSFKGQEFKELIRELIEQCNS